MGKEPKVQLGFLPIFFWGGHLLKVCWCAWRAGGGGMPRLLRHQPRELHKPTLGRITIAACGQKMEPTKGVCVCGGGKTSRGVALNAHSLLCRKEAGISLCPGLGGAPASEKASLSWLTRN